MVEMIVAWDLSGSFDKDFDKLDNQLQEYLDKKASFNDQILNRRSRIAELSKEIESLETQKVKL